MELDDDFAGELRPLRPPARVRPWVPRLAASIAIGTRAGLVLAVGVGVAYFVQNYEWDMPWLTIGSLLVLFGPALGILLAVVIDAAIALADRVTGPLVVVANPVTAGCAGGFCAGIAPGAIGVAVFGAYHGPFVGTPAIAGGLVAGAVLIAVPLVRAARERRGLPRRRRATLLATCAATLVLCAAAATLAPVIVDGAFVEVQTAIDDQGAFVGAIAGAFGGAIVGIYIGLAIALGRALR